MAGMLTVPIGTTRHLDKVTEAQLACIEGVVTQGWSLQRAALALDLDQATIRAWMRDPTFIAACNELVRAYCSFQLVPLALTRLRQEMARPGARPSDVARAGKVAAELAGLLDKREAGSFAPVTRGESAHDLTAASAEDLRRIAREGAAALARLRSSERA